MKFIMFHDEINDDNCMQVDASNAYLEDTTLHYMRATFYSLLIFVLAVPVITLIVYLIMMYQKRKQSSIKMDFNFHNEEYDIDIMSQKVNAKPQKEQPNDPNI